MTGALGHLRVLDMSRVLAGPWAGQVLADLGAEVIKVEMPGRGDDTRSWGPPYLKDEAGEDTDQAAYFLSANRNKRSLCLDIASARGQAIIRQLAAQSDVLIENFKVGKLAEYGLDFASLHALNPKLVYCSITGFGQTGPYAPRAGYDFLIQGMGGLMSITGRRDGEPGEGPQKVGVAVVDIMTGLYATVGILSALAHRDRTGQGQHVDLALLDVQIAGLANQAANYLATGVAPTRLGNAHPNIVPYQDFKTADGHVIVAVGNDGQFRRFCDLLGVAALADDPRFASNAARVVHREVLIPLLQDRLQAAPSRDWIDRMEAVGVPCGPINTLEEVFDDPHVRARGLALDMPHPTAGRVKLVANPIRLSASPAVYERAPPTLGQDTADILADLCDLSPAEIAELAAAGVI